MMRRVRLALVGTQGQAVRAEAPVRAGPAEAAPAPLVVQAAGAARAVRPETQEPPAAQGWMADPAAPVARAVTTDPVAATATVRAARSAMSASTRAARRSADIA